MQAANWCTEGICTVKLVSAPRDTRLSKQACVGAPSL